MSKEYIEHTKKQVKQSKSKQKLYVTDKVVQTFHRNIARYGTESFTSQDTIRIELGHSRKQVNRAFQYIRENSIAFEVGIAVKRPNSHKNETIHVKYTPLYVDIMAHMAEDFPHLIENVPPLNPRNEVEGSLMLLPSRGTLVSRITKKLKLTAQQVCELEGWTEQQLRNGFREMLRYLYAGKSFYRSAFAYFRGILLRRYGKQEDLRSRVVTQLAKCATLVAKHIEFIAQIAKIAAYSSLPCTEDFSWVITDSSECEAYSYWSDYEEREIDD